MEVIIPPAAAVTSDTVYFDFTNDRIPIIHPTTRSIASSVPCVIFVVVIYISEVTIYDRKKPSVLIPMKYPTPFTNFTSSKRIIPPKIAAPIIIIKLSKIIKIKVNL